MEIGITHHAEPRTATPTAAPPSEPTSIADRWWQRAWQRLLPAPTAIPDQNHQLNQQLVVLEGARAELEAGWVQGRWWKTTTGGDPGHVDGVCLVGALVRAGTGQNTRPGGTSENSISESSPSKYGPSESSASENSPSESSASESSASENSPSESSENPATGRAVDAVYDALWASRGQSAPATHLVPSPQVRLARVRMLTQWNDRPGRTKSEVMTVVDRAISATILTLMATPHPATHSRQPTQHR